MNPFHPLRLSVSAFTAALSINAVAQAPTQPIEQISIFGSKNPINTVPGSAHQINQAQLDTFKYTDIMRTLSSVPGVYIQEEDGYGLRPNLGMRGTGQNRSEKITVMEDGVLAAPAPYASPAAYYFPTSGRMQSVEMMKGGSTVKYGPRTTGGVINMVSRQIPQQDLAGKLDVALGEDGFGKLHTHAGGQGERIGAVAEIYRYQADGFKDINAVGGDTGFTKNDALAKVRINTDKTARYQQALELKLKFADETSHETYMGLTNADYQISPQSRYSASQKDLMTTEHKHIQLNHIIDFTDTLSLSTIAYYNDFHRNWYKADKVGGDSLSKGGIQKAANFDAGLLTTLDVNVKANNRDYLSQGIQTELNLSLGDHDLAFGARYHEDEMDRYQWADSYAMDANKMMTRTKSGVPGTDSNLVDSASAFSAYVQDKITLGDVAITAGIRFEDVDTQRQDWGKTNTGREGNPSKEIDNSFSAVLPSLAATYQLNEQLILLAGVQKGFSPAAPGNAEGDEEQSWNYEAGMRYNQAAFNSELVAFYSDYSNMHGNCTEAQGCDASNVGNQYNAGEVDVKGVEFSLGYEFNQTGGISFPVKLAYTYTNAEFTHSFTSEFETWEKVTAGDKLTYLPENQVYVSAGMQSQDWQLTLAARYTDEMRTKAGSGTISADQLIDAKTIVDLSARYFVTDAQEVYLTVDNLLDEYTQAT
ncbi:MAG: TonB-dependent receptor family protein [Shewanella sp.]